MRIAIDGPAGSGKSTVAHALADRRNLTLLDTGAMYRAVTLACLRQGIDVHDAEAVGEVAQGIRIDFATIDGVNTVALDGSDVTADIRTPEVDANVSAVAAIASVREAMVERQRELGRTGDVVAEGRDIGTVVFPGAEVKVFLTADPAARAHRRAVQRNGQDAATDPAATADEGQEKAILEDLMRRDAADSTREVAPLKPAEDAVHIDSSRLTVDEVVAKICALMDAVAEAGGKEGGSKPEEAQKPTTPQLDEPTANESDASESTSAKRPQAKARVKDEAKPKVKEESPYDKFYDTGMREFPLASRALLAATVGVCGLLSKVFWPWKLENGERLWEAEGGRMVIMNHVSMLDPVLLVVTDWAHGRRMRPIYKSEFDKRAIVKWFFSQVGSIPVKRGTADIKAVRRAQRALQRGEDVLVFPEGTRIYSDDQEVTLHAGFALMAQLAKVPVLPIAIVGARDGAPGGNKPLRPHRVFLRVGKEISFDELGVNGRKKAAAAMEKEAMRRVYELRDELRAEHPGKM